jgi:hypothetical protein
MTRLVAVLATIAALTGCHDQPTVYEQYTNRCEQLGGKVVKDGWNGNVCGLALIPKLFTKSCRGWDERSMAQGLVPGCGFDAPGDILVSVHKPARVTTATSHCHKPALAGRPQLLERHLDD